MKALLYTRLFTLAVFAFSVMAVMSLAACGGGGSESGQDANQTEEVMENGDVAGHEHPSGGHEHPSGGHEHPSGESGPEPDTSNEEHSADDDQSEHPK